MLSLLFLRSKTVCFISLDKTSPKSNDCCNFCEALLALRPLRFNKLRTDFCGALLRVVFSCFLSTAFLLSFRVVPVPSILRFFFSDHLFLLLFNPVVTLAFPFPKRLFSFRKFYINDERADRLNSNCTGSLYKRINNLLNGVLMFLNSSPYGLTSSFLLIFD